MKGSLPRREGRARQRKQRVQSHGDTKGSNKLFCVWTSEFPRLRDRELEGQRRRPARLMAKMGNVVYVREVHEWGCRDDIVRDRL